MAPGIVTQMTTLAQCTQVVICAVLRIVIEVRHGQDNLRSRYWVQLMVLRAAEFAHAARPVTDAARDGRPV